MDERPTMKERFLSNPHITIDDKRARQLGINTNELKRKQTDATDAGPAVEIPDDTPQVRQEVVVRGKRNVKTTN